MKTVCPYGQSLKAFVMASDSSSDQAIDSERGFLKFWGSLGSRGAGLKGVRYTGQCYSRIKSLKAPHPQSLQSQYA